ncbi:hypothetical protein [Ferrimonas kyonanensis]|uniref:hypothetical protein n=1 Tax=Ferrimonas kyonanensis TaxID=364763 RepID=UPI0003F97FAD|nr:hypothetical protein [Ferrimonas kyonanensis]
MNRFSLSDAILLSGLALLLVSFKAVVRLKLGLTGHSMFLLVLVYLLARGLVPQRGSVLYCGLMTGLLALIMGVGKGGPLVLLKFLLPAMAMELALLLLPMAPWFTAQALLVAAAALTVWVGKGALELWLAGADPALILVQSGWKTLGGGLFSILGACCTPMLLQRLAHHQLIPTHRQPQ